MFPVSKCMQFFLACFDNIFIPSASITSNVLHNSIVLLLESILLYSNLTTKKYYKTQKNIKNLKNETKKITTKILKKNV